MEQEQIKQTMKEIINNREEILRAFVAKYGCGPDEIIQVMQKTEDGGIKFCVRARSEEEADLGSIDYFLKTQIEACASGIRQAAFRNDKIKAGMLTVRMGAFRETAEEIKKRGKITA